MASAKFLLEKGHPRVVGSFGSLQDLREATTASVTKSCDLVEIRLDLLTGESEQSESTPWSHLADVPLLFTARRAEEGGAVALDAASRVLLLRSILDHAAWLDIEVASIPEMRDFLKDLAERAIPWIASYHDFEKLPDTAVLEDAAKRAKAAGAAVFKAAAMLASPADVARLAGFQLADHGLRVATMGMGRLATVSRLLCAQCGSVLNYGYLGNTATAPGQWDSAMLKNAISRLVPFSL